jgi:hypothetical protein
MNIKELADEAAKYSAIMALPTGQSGNELFVKKFAELVAAHEREECAKVVDKRLSNWASLAGKDKAYKWLEKLANAIRARGKA